MKSAEHERHRPIPTGYFSDDTMLSSSTTTSLTQPRLGLSRAALQTLFGHQLAAFVSGGADFLMMIALVRLAGWTPTLATVGGAATGAVVNFALGRRVVFARSSHNVAPMGPQVLRYALVSGTSLLFNASGEYLITHLSQLHYVVGRAFIALLVSLCWNFPMQRHFVFGRSSAA